VCSVESATQTDGVQMHEASLGHWRVELPEGAANLWAFPNVPGFPGSSGLTTAVLEPLESLLQSPESTHGQPERAEMPITDFIKLIRNRPQLESVTRYELKGMSIREHKTVCRMERLTGGCGRHSMASRRKLCLTDAPVMRRGVRESPSAIGAPRPERAQKNVPLSVVLNGIVDTLRKQSSESKDGCNHVLLNKVHEELHKQGHDMMLVDLAFAAEVLEKKGHVCCQGNKIMLL